MKLASTIKKILPRPMAHWLSRAAYPYLHGGRFFKPYVIKKEMEGVSFDFLIGDRTGRNWYDRVCINNPVWREMGFVRDNMMQKRRCHFRMWRAPRLFGNSVVQLGG